MKKCYLLILVFCFSLFLSSCNNKKQDTENTENTEKTEKTSHQTIKNQPISDTTETDLTEEDFINWYVSYMQLQDKYPKPEDKPKFDEEYNKLFSDSKYSKESFLAFQEKIRLDDPEHWLIILEKIQKKIAEKPIESP